MSAFAVAIEGKADMTIAPHMSAFDGGLNRSPFFLLGFEFRGLAHTASDPEVPGFSATAKLRKNPLRFVIHSVFPFKTEDVASTG